MIDKIWKKLVNRETISYLIFGVLTTLVDWISYWYMRRLGIDYRAATAGSWAAAVLFAFVTNKPFVACRAATGAFTMVAMIVMVDGLGIRQDFICKIVVSAISLVLNYIFSKWFIFRKKES